MPQFEIYVSTTVGRSVIVEATSKGDAEKCVEVALKNGQITVSTEDRQDGAGNLIFNEDDNYSGASTVNVQPGDETEFYSDAFIQKKWNEFANVAITNDDKLDEDFYFWKKGTDKMLIWHWFDEHYSEGVAALAGITN